MSSSILSLPSLVDDFHIHLRDDALMKTVIQQMKYSGVGRCFVMPNLVPPVITPTDAIAYRQRLYHAWKEAHGDIAPPQFKMLLFLDQSMPPNLMSQLTPEETMVVQGIKSYPKGVTTNSENGVEGYEQFYPLFRDLERNSKSLHLHGEVPGEDPLTAEAKFLPTFERLARDFPHLRIVLEHTSTKAAVDSVSRLGYNVGATITPQHALATQQDVFNSAYLSRDDRDMIITRADIKNDHLFCKPVLKGAADRDAIQDAIFTSAHRSRFFFGSDSAPHWAEGGKDNDCCPAAGCYSAPIAAETFVSLARAKAADGFGDQAMVEIDAFLRLRGASFFNLKPLERGGIEFFTADENEKVSTLNWDGLVLPEFNLSERVNKKVRW